MNVEYILGVVCGVVSVFFVAYIIKYIVGKLDSNEEKKYPDEYDERQILARGKAYKYGFHAMMFAMLINGYIMDYVFEWCTNIIFAFTNLIIGLLVFAAVSIFNDAYLKLSENPVRAIILFLFCGICNLISPVTDYIRNKTLLDEDGKFYNMNLECAVLMCIIIIMLFVKMYITKREEGDEYKES